MSKINYDKAREEGNRQALYDYWFDRLKQQEYTTGRTSIITDEEYEEYVQIFVEYDMAWKRFPANHPKFPNMPMARTIRNYFDYNAKVHGYETYSEFVRWKYKDGPWKPSGQLFYIDYKYGDNGEE
jgi:hypothetical protein